MSKYKKPKVGFLDHVDGKQNKKDPVDEVLKEAAESAPEPEPKKTKTQTKKPVIREEVQPSAPGMESYVKATQVSPNSAKGSFDNNAVEGYVPPVIEQKTPETDPSKMTAYQKALKEAKKKKTDSLQHLGEAADLLGGEAEKPVTQADLRALKVSLASLGGGGLGERDVIDLINKYGADSISDILDSSQINQIIDSFRQLESTDSLQEGQSNLYYTDARVDSNFAEKTTDDLTEGNNLYYTDSRARHAIQSIDSAINYDQATGNIALDANHPIFDPYNSNDFDSDFGLKSTDSLSEGVTNLYYTDSRARNAIQSIDSSLIYDSTTGNLSLAIDPDEFYTTVDFDSDFLTKNTDSLTEGSTNLYYTDSRARAAISSGDSFVIYDSLSGEISLSAKLSGDFVERTGDSMSGDLRMRSGSGILVDSGNVRTLHGYVQTNELKSVGNSNIVVKRNDERRMLWGTNNIVADRKIRYNEGYSTDSYTSDLEGRDSYTLMPKWYVDNVNEKSLLASTDSLPEGVNNLYWTQGRFDSAFDSTNIRSDHDSLSARVDSDDIEIQTLKNKVDQLDLSSALQIQYNKILSYDSATDSVPVGSYGLHFDGSGTEYINIDKLFIHHTDRNGVHVPFGVIDSGDTIIITDSDGGLGRYEVNAFQDRGNHHEFDVTVQAGQGAPADLAAMKIFPEQNLNALASMDYVDAQDKVLQDQINNLDSALDSEHAWNISEHSSLSDRLDSERALNLAEHAALDSSLRAQIESDKSELESSINDLDSALDSDRTRNASEHSEILDRLDSAYAWNVAEHSELGSKIDSNYAWSVDKFASLDSNLDSEISGKVSKSGDTMTGDLTISNPNKLSTNQIWSIGDSNISIRRNSSTKIQITSTENKQFQKMKYNSDYGVSDDMDVPHKKYVDSSIEYAIDSAVEANRFTFDSSQFVAVEGDEMSGQLAISRTDETNVGLRIKKDTQSRFTIRTDGLLNWTNDATDARLNKTGGDLAISIDDVNYLKFDQSQGDIEVAKTLTLTAPDQAINLPNNSATGQLHSNGNRRLYWDQNNVGIDVGLEMNAQINMNGGNGRNKIVNLAVPTDDYHAVNKIYLDSNFVTKEFFEDNSGASLHIDSASPAGPSSGELWLDRNTDTVKIYDGNFWFDFPSQKGADGADGAGGAGGDFIKNGSETTLTGPTKIISNGTKYINIQAAPTETQGFFVMRDNAGKNLMLVYNSGKILLKAGRLATDLDEITTKRYVDAKVGRNVIGRRFKYDNNAEAYSSSPGVFGYTGSKLQLSKTDLDGEKMVHPGSPDFAWTTGSKFTIRDPDTGYFVIMGETSQSTDYTSTGMRFRMTATNLKYGSFSSLVHGKEYHIVVEGYF